MRTFILFFTLVAGVTGQGFSTTFLQNTLFGGDRSDFGVSSWSDQSRGVRYIVGQTYSSEFSGTPLSGDFTLGAPDILLVKLDQATDSLLWYTIVGTSRSDQPRAVTGDSEGNIWVTGQTFGSFDDSDSNGAARGFVLKLDSNGKTLQTITIDSFQPSAIDSDANGNIWLAGSATQNTADELNSNEDVAVIILSSVTGEQIASQTFGGSASDAAKTISVAQSTVAIGGVTYSSDFPVTKGDRECEFCNGAGFVMTLTYDATNGIKQTFSTYINGEESQSLSVVDITFDSHNNMYLSLFDDSNAMGAYIQQFKSDFTFGWVSDKSDAFWKVEYLPLIDALYTIGSFSTPTDYATFLVLDTKTGSTVYSSKALTGALVDASVFAVDESSVKVSLIGTLQKDLRITHHGRTYTTTHKSDDVLIVSLTLRSLAVVKAQPKPAVVSKDVSTRSYDPSEGTLSCLWNCQNGFGPFNDLLYSFINTSAYTVLQTATTAVVILPWNHGHDYDVSYNAALSANLIEFALANAGRAARLAAGAWGNTFDAFFSFGFRTYTQTVQHYGYSYIVLNIPGNNIATVVLKNNGRTLSGDLVSWTVEVTLAAFQSEAVQTVSATLDPKAAAQLNVWISFDATVSSNNFQVFVSTDSVAIKPSTTSLQFTFTAARISDWLTKEALYPKISSGSSLETLFLNGYVCGLTAAVSTVPILISPLLPITGSTAFPPDSSSTGIYIGQTVVPTSDSVSGLKTKIQFFKSDNTIFNSAWLYIYNISYNDNPNKIRKVYEAGYMTSMDISGTGTLTGWQVDEKYQFKKGVRYFLYIAADLFASDNLYTSTTQSTKRDQPVTNEPMIIWDPNTSTWIPQNYTSVVFSISSLPFANSDPLGVNETSYNTGSPNQDGGGACLPGTEGCVEKDPFFVGFNGQRYEFDGHAGHTYNIYNDPWVNINSFFGYANEKKKTGTVMHSIGVSIGQHNLFFDITNRENRRFFDVVIDGVTTRVGYSTQHLTGCVDLQYNTKILLITTPRHSIRLTIEWGKNWHINVPYFDLHIHHPSSDEDLSQIGGVLGQTAGENKGDKVDIQEDDFEITGENAIFSFAKSNFYNLESIDC